MRPSKPMERPLSRVPRPGRAGHARARALVPAAVAKMFLLASVSVVGSGWALVRYYTHPHLPMVVPVQASGEADAGGSDASEIPAPELVPIAP
jgi:hypothetical protein